MRSEVRIWIAVYIGAMSILTDVSPIHIFGPAVDLHIDEVDVLTWVRCVTSDDAWVDESALRGHVLKCDVSHVDQWLRLTALERVSEAAGTRAIRLLLLLWSNVDAKPKWEVDVEVFVKDVLNFSRSRVSWVSLYINSFHWVIKVYVFEVNSSDTCMIITRRNRSNDSPDAKKHSHVLNIDVLRATILGHLIGLVRWLDCNGIIPIRDLNILNGHI